MVGAQPALKATKSTTPRRRLAKVAKVLTIVVVVLLVLAIVIWLTSEKPTPRSSLLEALAIAEPFAIAGDPDAELASVDIDLLGTAWDDGKYEAWRFQFWSPQSGREIWLHVKGRRLYLDWEYELRADEADPSGEWRDLEGPPPEHPVGTELLDTTAIMPVAWTHGREWAKDMGSIDWISIKSSSDSKTFYWEVVFCVSKYYIGKGFVFDASSGTLVEENGYTCREYEVPRYQ